MNINDFIFSTYEEYKDFMVYKPLTIPKLNIVQNLNDDSTFAYVMSDELDGNTVNLYYSPKLFCENDTSLIKSKLYHEFTHIYDRRMFFQKYNGENII